MSAPQGILYCLIKVNTQKNNCFNIIIKKNTSGCLTLARRVSCIMFSKKKNGISGKEQHIGSPVCFSSVLWNQ